MTDATGGGASRSTDPAAGTSQATDVSLREHLTSLIDAAEKRSDQRFEAMKEAVAKADTANEKRLEGFPQQFADRSALALLTDKLQVQIDRNREDLDALSKRIDLREGQTEGSRITWGNMVVLIGTAATLLGIVAFAANYLAQN